MSKIEAGETVVIFLREPREKVWGVLQEINAAGVYARGIDLNSFEEFVRAAQAGEPLYGLSNLFFPLWRVERITKDEPDGAIPSMAEQFTSRTGISISDL